MMIVTVLHSFSYILMYLRYVMLKSVFYWAVRLMCQRISWLGSTFLKPGKAQSQDVVRHITPMKQQIVTFTCQLLCTLNKPDSNDVTSIQSFKLHHILESSVPSKEILGELCILSGPIPIDGFSMFQPPPHFKPVAAKCSHCNEF